MKIYFFQNVNNQRYDHIIISTKEEKKTNQKKEFFWNVKQKSGIFVMHFLMLIETLHLQKEDEEKNIQIDSRMKKSVE